MGAELDGTVRADPARGDRDLVQHGVTQSDYSLTGATTVVVTMAARVVFTLWLSFRVARCGRSWRASRTLLIADGRVLDVALRRQRMATEELRTEARLHSIRSLDDLRYAVLETNGKISFITAAHD